MSISSERAFSLEMEPFCSISKGYDLWRRLEIVCGVYGGLGMFDGVLHLDLSITYDELKEYSSGDFLKYLESIFNDEQRQEFMRSGVVVRCSDGQQIYFDQHETHATAITVNHENDIFYSCRLISSAGGHMLPSWLRGAIERPSDADSVEYLEFSQLVKNGKVPKWRQSFFLLLKGAIRISNERGVKFWHALIEEKVFKALNIHYHLGMTSCGDGIKSLGVNVVPVVIDIQTMLDNIGRGFGSALVNFLNGSQDDYPLDR